MKKARTIEGQPCFESRKEKKYIPANNVSESKVCVSRIYKNSKFSNKKINTPVNK